MAEIPPYPITMGGPGGAYSSMVGRPRTPYWQMLGFGSEEALGAQVENLRGTPEYDRLRQAFELAQSGQDFDQSVIDTLMYIPRLIQQNAGPLRESLHEFGDRADQRNLEGIADGLGAAGDFLSWSNLPTQGAELNRMSDGILAQSQAIDPMLYGPQNGRPSLPAAGPNLSYGPQNGRPAAQPAGPGLSYGPQNGRPTQAPSVAGLGGALMQGQVDGTTGPLGIGNFISGQAPRSTEEITNIAEQAILQAEQSGAQPEEIAQSMGLPTPIQQAAQDERDQEQGRRGFLEWLMPDLEPDQRRQALLAIGTGLLAGNDWQEGFAYAGQNLQAMMGGIEDQEREDQLLQEERQFTLMRDQMNRDSQASSNIYNRPFNVVGRDPETGQELVRQGILINGVAHVIGENGEPVPAHEVMSDVRVGGRSEGQDVVDGYGGIPNAGWVSADGVPNFSFQRESEAQAYSWAVRAINADMNLNAMIDHYGPEAFTTLTAGLSRWASQNASAAITPAVINSIVEDAGMTGSMASSASQYLQAILRSDTGAAYTGTEIADYAGSFLPNAGDDPQTIAQKRRDRLIQLYALAGRTGAAGPYLLGVLDGSYELPGERWSAPTGSGPLNQSNGATIDPEVEDILQSLGL